MSDDTQTSPKLTGAVSNPLTSSVEGSHVNQSVKQDIALPNKMSDGSGLSLFGAFAYYDHATSSLKMCQESLFLDLPECFETWPRAGMMQNGIVFQHQHLVPRINGIESGLYATPNASDTNHRSKSTYGRVLSRELGGIPNPTWVEWLMGFPLGWTDCVDSATPSSRKSLSGSDGNYWLTVKDQWWELRQGKTVLYVKPLHDPKVSWGDRETT